MKRFERSNGLDTALYKNDLFLIFLLKLITVGTVIWYGIFIFHIQCNVISKKNS